MKHCSRVLIPVALSFGLAACGADYGSIDKDPYPPNVPLSGIWSGTYTITPDNLTATQTVSVLLVGSETNEFWIIENNETLGCATIGYGQANSIQSALTGSYGWGGCSFADGSSSGNATFSGTATLHDTLSLTINKLTAKGTTVGSFAPDFTFVGEQYLTESSLATVAGSYTNGTDPVTIDAGGKITEPVIPGVSCSGSGTVSVINPSYNLYRVQFTYANCTADADKTLNNVTFTGLGFFDAADHQFIATYHGTDTSGTPVISDVAWVIAGTT